MRLHLLWQHFGLVKGYGGASAAQKRKRKITIIQCVFLDVCSVLFLFCLYICVCLYLQTQVPLRECHSIQPGVCRPPDYCEPIVCVPAVIGVLAV